MEEAALAGYQKQHAVLPDRKTGGIGYAMAAPEAIRFGAVALMLQPHPMDRLFGLSLTRRYV